MKYKHLILPSLLIVGMIAVPGVAYCSVESTLSAVQNKFINVILPLVGILGIAWAGLSLVTGNPNAKSHIMWAVIGAGVGFGAPSIIAFVRGLVN